MFGHANEHSKSRLQPQVGLIVGLLLCGKPATSARQRRNDMNDSSPSGLLPVGMHDILPPAAGFEAEMVESLMGAFAAEGYERVKPPLVEFEDSLLAGSGAAMSRHTFRMMDPVSQRMMGVRPDMTIQIARIAATRLAAAPRPLRLSYAGQVLRVMGDEMRPERQFGQVGAELIGSREPAGDAEVVRISAGALAALGVAGLSVDISLPDLVPMAAVALGIAGDQAARLRKALDRKDVTAVAQHAGETGMLFGRLLRAAGPARQALAALRALDLPVEAREEVERIAAIVATIARDAPGLTLTVDPVESRGFEYHTGLCFTLFADGVQAELGRGGRYLAGVHHAQGAGEPATGFTLYTDVLLRALPAPQPRRRIYVPFGALQSRAAALRVEGWITVAGLAPVGDAKTEARRLLCTHVLDAETARAL
jgi:ATP phosphoribosyltransferase regulatory subunit